MIPTAGPSLLESNGAGGGGMGMGNSSVNKKLLSYLEKHQGNAKYLFATSDSTTAAPYIIKTGKAVMAMGGFNGTDPAISLSQFKKLVKTGQLKYFYYSGRSGNTKIINWIKKHATKVKTSLYQDSTQSQAGMFGQPGAASTGKKSAKAGTPTTGSKGQRPTGKPSAKKGTAPGSRPTTTKKAASTKANSAKATKKQPTAQPSMGGGMGGQSSVLYDLSTIYK